MRVIAGELRSRTLLSPAGRGTRPTSDRLRETLFNILAARGPLTGAHMADLFAGTGAVGIEALSRGAAFVHFAENNPAALRSLRANLSALRIAPARYRVDERGAASLLATLASAGKPLDLIFLDPPYDSADEYTRTLNLLGNTESLLAPNAAIVAEHATKSLLAASYGGMHRTRSLRQGDSTLSFYEQQRRETVPSHRLKHSAAHPPGRQLD